MSVLTTFIVKKKYKPEPKRKKTNWNRKRRTETRTVSSEPWVTDISVNRGSPSSRQQKQIGQKVR